MKKYIIGALVGGLILFVWQFVSWTFSGIHASEMRYTENQQEILDFLNGKLEEGSYFLPTVPPGTSAEEQQALAAEAEGKPWARISYHDSFSSGMTMNLVRGFVIDFVAVLLLCWLLMQFGSLNMNKAIAGSVAVGLIGYLSISYLNSIWFDTDTWGDLIDAVVSWTLVGGWLGWWLRK